MINEDLIISLIQQDMKHNQLLTGLERIGFDCQGLFDLGLLEIVSNLMKVPEGRISDRWSAMYVSFMQEAPHYEVSCLGEALEPLAAICYKQLKALLDYEKKRNGAGE